MDWRNLPEISSRLNGKEAICYYDPGDLGNVWVAHPADPHNPVPAEATYPEYQNGLTLTEHEKLKQAEKEDASKYDFAIPHLALDQLRQEIEEDYLRRKQANKSKKVLTPSKPQSQSPYTEATLPNISNLAEAIIDLPVDHL
ncbi:hypothetical protein [Pseudomonas sp.]|uniref:hypothetical protein n=1 Tax=Pseudomonas sp. TaxID=306 RepID=UPI003F352720